MRMMKSPVVSFARLPIEKKIHAKPLSREDKVSVGAALTVSRGFSARLARQDSHPNR
jgi:hypothetical protein